MQDYTKLPQEEKEALIKKAMNVGIQTETDSRLPSIVL